jgi:CHAT domain-containing protein
MKVISICITILLVSGFNGLLAFTLPNKYSAENNALLDRAWQEMKSGNGIEADRLLEQAFRSEWARDPKEAAKLFPKLLWIPLSDYRLFQDHFQQKLGQRMEFVKSEMGNIPVLKAAKMLHELQVLVFDENSSAVEEKYDELISYLAKYPNRDIEAAAKCCLIELNFQNGNYIWAEKQAESLKKSLDSLCSGKYDYEIDHTRFLHYFHFDLLRSYAAIKRAASDQKFSESFLFGLLETFKNDPARKFYILFDLGFFYYITDWDFQKGLEYFQAAQNIVKADEYWKQALCHAALGDIYISHSADKKAIPAYEKAIENFDKLKEKPTRLFRYKIDWLRSIATSYIKLGAYDKAEERLNTIKILPRVYDDKYSWTLATWGFFYERTAQYDKANKAHLESVTAYKNEGLNPSSAYWNLAQIANAQKDYFSALKYQHQNLSELSNVLNPNDIFSNPPKSEWVKCFLSGADFSDKLMAYYKYVNSHNNWNEHVDNLIVLFEITVSQLEYNQSKTEREISKAYLLKRSYNICELGLKIFAKARELRNNKEYISKMYDVLEKSKSYLLNDALKESDAGKFSGIPDELLQLQKKYESTISELGFTLNNQKLSASKQQEIESEIFENKTKLDKLKKQFEKEYPKYYAFKYGEQKPELKEIQAALPENTAIIAYFEGKNNLYRLFIDAKRSSMYIINADDNYRKKTENFHKILSDIPAAVQNSDKSINNLKALGFELYTMLIPQDIDKNIEHLIIIPDGSLNYIAFEALLSKQSVEQKRYQELPFLIKKYNISYNYSAQLWYKQKLSKRKEEKPMKILAMAASYPLNKSASDSLGLKLPPIPGAKEEVKRLENFISGKFLFEKEASESNFKKFAPEYGIVHLALHGLVNAEKPEYSCMAFTQQHNSEDELLHAYEIKQLGLNAKLIVLSACETGQGKYQHGEGVISIGRSFMYAGAPSVMMTLWQLHDQTSVQIIESYYKNLQQGMKKDVALRKAKLDFLEKSDLKNGHPAFWAAFIQLGDNEAIKISKKANAINIYLLMLSISVGVLLLYFGYRRFKRT